MKEFTRYWKALTYAFINYGENKRKSMDVPYAVHPVRITTILRAAGFNEENNEDLMIAALFHDLVEDTDTPIEEIKDEFGENVASIVLELTKPEGAKGNKKKEWLENFTKSSKEAKIVKMADRIDNLMDIGDFWTTKQQKDYAEQGKIILKTCGSAHKGLAQELYNVIEKVLNR